MSSAEVWQALAANKQTPASILTGNETSHLVESFRGLIKNLDVNENNLNAGKIISSFVYLSFPPKDESSIYKNLPQLKKTSASGKK